MDKTVIIPINDEPDIVAARKKVREIAQNLQFNQINQGKVLTAVSELARNICRYAGSGEIEIEMLVEEKKKGIRITAQDGGPGIPDPVLAMKRGFSSSGSLGAGMPGVKTMLDEFELDSVVGKGTVITAVKWQLS
jgi:serine/threonine-protein kinase RsbT